MRILLSSKIERDKKNKSLNYSIDINIINLLNTVYNDAKIFLYNSDKDLVSYDLFVIFGGNNLPKFSKKIEDKKRYEQDKKIIKYFCKNNKAILGICYGAQILAENYKSKIKKIDNHANTHHKILIDETKIGVNSYHDYGIYTLGNMLKPLATANDGTFEAFKSEDNKILGIMWHPERYDLFKKTDIQIIRNNLDFS